MREHYHSSNADVNRTLLGEVIYLRGIDGQPIWMTKKLKLRPLELTRLANARSLRGGGTTQDMATKLGKTQAQWQNTIGKTPTRAIGNDIAEQIERAYGLMPGEMSIPWPHGVPPSKAGPPKPDTALEAMRFAIASLFSLVVVARPEVAGGMAGSMRAEAAEKHPELLRDEFFLRVTSILDNAAVPARRRR